MAVIPETTIAFNERREYAGRREITPALREYLRESASDRIPWNLSEGEIREARAYFLECKVRKVLERHCIEIPQKFTFKLPHEDLVFETHKPYAPKPLSQRVCLIVERPSGEGLRFDIDTMNGSTTQREKAGLVVIGLALLAFVSWLLFNTNEPTQTE